MKIIPKFESLESRNLMSSLVDVRMPVEPVKVRPEMPSMFIPLPEDDGGWGGIGGGDWEPLPEGVPPIPRPKPITSIIIKIGDVEVPVDMTPLPPR